MHRQIFKRALDKVNRGFRLRAAVAEQVRVERAQNDKVSLSNTSVVFGKFLLDDVECPCSNLTSECAALSAANVSRTAKKEFEQQETIVDSWLTKES